MKKEKFSQYSAGILTGIFTAASLTDNFLFNCIDSFICQVDKNYQAVFKMLIILALLVGIYGLLYSLFYVLSYFYEVWIAKVDLSEDLPSLYKECLELGSVLFNEFQTYNNIEERSRDSASLEYIKGKMLNSVTSYVAKYQIFLSCCEAENPKFENSAAFYLRKLEFTSNFVRFIDHKFSFNLFRVN